MQIAYLMAVNRESFFRIVVEFSLNVSDQTVDASDVAVLAISEIHSESKLI